MSAQHQPSAALNTALNAALSDAREQWRSNPRLRYGVYMIIAIMWGYGILVLRDTVTAKREAWIAAEARIARARSLANSGDWVNRASEVKAAMGDFGSLLWKEGSLGLAQAAVQESVNRTLASAGLTARQIKVTVSDAPLAAEMNEIVPIRARVVVDFRPPLVNAWLAALARDVSEKRPAIVIESLSIRGAPAPVADIELVAYALRPEAVGVVGIIGGTNAPSNTANKANGGSK